tara:strand:- start:998 stop:1606 length:609 start_codon:yes stop_codon:yes gene_type:complete
MECFTREQVQKAVESKDYRWFEGGDYNLNIVGIRNSDTQGKVTNKFDDCVTVSYSVNGEMMFHCFGATTDPGSHWERNLMNKDGVAILVPGQYRGSHIIGLHQGKYEALRQKSPLKVYRDKNKDGVYDFTEESIKEGIYGINIHRATSREGGKSTQIDRWSAGCQVIAANSDFKLFMELTNKSAKLYGNSFTYTLIESKDIV